MRRLLPLIAITFVLFASASATAHASLSLTAGSNATTTPNVATAITGFQIVGPAASTTPVKLRATSGTLSLATTSGVTMSGNTTNTVTLSGTVERLNIALASLTYSRTSTGTDILEVSLVEAGEVFFEDNGHLYKFISDAGTWNAAKTKAEALTLYGVPGYLATITSSAENSFVTARLTNAGWMGASDSAVEGAWRWVTGPENGTQFWSGASGGSTVGGNYANWNTGEPNDSGGEDCGQYLSGGTGRWNDLPCATFSLPGYVAEFGAPGALPTVVAQNISIVTADVPAIVSLSPSNGAANATSTANLVMTFTKAVSKGSGNISIRRSSDDTLFEAIDVTTSQVTGAGTTVITINPTQVLTEGVQYYVTVPSTAFTDTSGNAFGGITGTSTWTFTIADLTAPNITNVTAAAATTTATVSWTTNEVASSRLWYSVDTSYASSTSEINTSPRVTNHSSAITGLRSCTRYQYQAVSRDAAGNAATSTASFFITAGCSGTAIPTTSTTSAFSVTATSTVSLVDSERTLNIVSPAFVTASSSSMVIQIKALARDTVLAAIGRPIESLTSVAPIVFNVTALFTDGTELDSFAVPVTVSYTYKDEDVTGLREDSLSMYHYRNGIWSELDDCSVSTSTNTITCTAPHFSVFAVFGTVQNTTSRSSSGTSIQAQVRNLQTLGLTARADELIRQWHWLFPNTAAAQAATVTVRNLELGMEGDDVRRLQILLNAQGHTLASSGFGSPGMETTYFGSRTQQALAKYQRSLGVTPTLGYFGPITRAAIKNVGVTDIWW